MPELQGFHYLAENRNDTRPPLLLLHGSSRDETELLPLAEKAAPGWPYMSLRGVIRWEQGYAFFRRRPDRTLDHADLALQTERLHDFILSAMATGVIARPPILLGFSNGAIIAASLVIRDPACVAGAILMRPLWPDLDMPVPAMSAKPILILSGDRDERRVPGDALVTADRLGAAGCSVTSHILRTGHDIHAQEPAIIGDWLGRMFFPLVAGEERG